MAALWRRAQTPSRLAVCASHAAHSDVDTPHLGAVVPVIRDRFRREPASNGVAAVLLRIARRQAEISQGKTLLLRSGAAGFTGARVQVNFGRPRNLPGCPTAPALYPVPFRRLRSWPRASSPPRLAATRLPPARDSHHQGPQRTSTSSINAMPGTQINADDTHRRRLGQHAGMEQRIARALVVFVVAFFISWHALADSLVLSCSIWSNENRANDVAETFVVDLQPQSRRSAFRLHLPQPTCASVSPAAAEAGRTRRSRIST